MKCQEPGLTAQILLLTFHLSCHYLIQVPITPLPSGSALVSLLVSLLPDFLSFHSVCPQSDFLKILIEPCDGHFFMPIHTQLVDQTLI